MQYARGSAAVVVVLALSTLGWAQAVSGLLQKGIYTEETVGDLDAAIKIYEQIVAETEANRSHVAQAHYRLGMCYLKKGQKPEAVAAFQKVVEQFPKQTELVAQARARLSALGQPSSAVVVRQVWANAVDDYFKGVPSPDGKYISYKDLKSGDVAVHELATGKNRRLTNQGWPEWGDFPIFSPDSKQVAYSWFKKDRVSEIRTIGVDGSGLCVLYPNKEKEVGYLETRDWSADGKQILATFVKKGAGQIVLVSVEDGSVRVLKSLDRGTGGKMRLSPDGRYVAYDYPPQKNSRQRDIFLLATDGSGEVPLVAHPADDFVLGWAPDGKRVVFASDRTGSMGVWLIAVADGKPQGAPELVKLEMGQFYGMGLTRSGSFYYGLWSGGQNVYTATLDLEKGKLVSPPVEAIQRGEGSNWAPAWSPDGKYLACLSHRPEPNDVFYIRSSASKEVRELVVKDTEHLHFNVSSLQWSPDGRALLTGFGTRIDVETGTVTRLVRSRGMVLYPQWAPDGKAVFYLGFGKGGRRTLRQDLQTGVEQELYQTSDYAEQWTLSPDGRQLAFAVGGALKLLPTTGSEPRELVKGERKITTVAWTPDGRHLLFGRSSAAAVESWWRMPAELWRIPAGGGEAQKLAQDLPAMGHLRIHPDGRQIAFTAHSPQPDKTEVWVMENFLPPPKAGP